MSYDSDIIVIGSGAGGATFAYACARAGRRVLLIEGGRRFVPRGEAHDEQAMLIDKEPYDERTVSVNGQPRRLYLGGILGGGTALYGAALIRPSADDFHPGRHYGERIPRAVWDWPVAYDELEPFYTEAEELYGVAGCDNDDFAPLSRPSRGFRGEPLPLLPINQRLMAANRAHGLHPFRLPLAIESRRCLRCSACAGYVCPNGARTSSHHLVDRAAAESLPLTVITHAEVESFCRDGTGQVSGVLIRDRATGRRVVYRGRRYALAAGALGSPTILLRSGFESPLIGRNYMYHLAPVVAGVFARRTGAESTFAKQVGFADYYFGTKDFAHKMGLVQSLSVPGPLMTLKSAGRRLPRGVVRFLRQRMLPFAGLVEDLPSPANRVTLNTQGGPELHHAFAPYDVERGRQLRRLMKRILRRAGARFCLSRPSPSAEHVAHQCGTLRFGRRPAEAVADPDCRMFGQPNLFLVDGSIFPTSLGVGPALTIIANALRVARRVAGEV